MSRRNQTDDATTARTELGERLRRLREGKVLPLREVAAAGIDSTLLSKIELGQRLPTAAQAAAFARFFDLDAAELEAARIAEKFWRAYGDNPAAHLALDRIQERAGEYHVKKRQKL